MCTTFTSLFQAIPRSSKRQKSDSWREDAENVKRLLLGEGFNCQLSDEVPDEDSQGSPTVMSYFRHGSRLLTVQLTCTQTLITLDLTERSRDKQGTTHQNKSDAIYAKLQETLHQFEVHRTVPLRRGDAIWQYGELGDGRISETDFTEIIVDERSEFQRVTIGKSKEFGNILLLDWIENLSEADSSYTCALCGLDRPKSVDYEGKSVLILGGGDGAALNAIRKLKPLMITMIEIDEVVMKACSKYLRGCCEDSLDKYEGDNYKIHVGDCVEYMRKYEKEGRKFDYIISDITDVPIVKEVNKKLTNNSNSDDYPVAAEWLSGPGWTFFRQLHNSSLKLLNQGGQIFTHVTARSNEAGIRQFESGLQQLDQKVAYELFDTFVPSFCEKWMFCHMKKA